MMIGMVMSEVEGCDGSHVDVWMCLGMLWDLDVVVVLDVIHEFSTVGAATTISASKVGMPLINFPPRNSETDQATCRCEHGIFHELIIHQSHWKDLHAYHRMTHDFLRT